VPARRAGSQQPSAERRERLTDYDAKRDFALTPEPAPGATETRGGNRFVIHEHHASRLHWDLRLERGGALSCWAIPKALPEAPNENRFAAATEEHPLEYLDFAGEIPKGQYGAGVMKIWDRGTYDTLKWEPRKVEVALHGERVDARYALFPIEPGEQPGDWMIHRMDPAADPEREPMPAQIVPMLARAGQLPREDGGWAYEIKWDGVRAIAYSQPGELRLESRNLNDITHSYPELARVGRALGSHDAILDGEIVAFDGDGRPSFAALQQRMHVADRAHARKLAAATPVTYIAFDLLWLDGQSLMGLPYEQRRQLLGELELGGEHVQAPEHVSGEGAALLQASSEQGLEGIIAKRLQSTYSPGLRTHDWIKIKSVARQEFVVGGWIAGKGKRSQHIGALLLGVYEDDGALRYVGRVGSGFSDAELERLSGLLAGLPRADSPFATGEALPRGAEFCEPRLVVEVEFAHWTDRGSLRQPTYKGLREDKPAEQVVREDQSSQFATVPASEATAGAQQASRGGGGGLTLSGETDGSATASVGGRELRLSNLDKVLYPDSAFSKRDLIDYYAAIAAVIVPHLDARALTVTRWPDGVEGKSFFQKQAPAHRPEWVRTATVASARKPIDYVIAGDQATLVWLANLAAIELHTPLARADSIERPTVLVFDLDPGAPATIVECCEVALQLQGMFENLGMQSFAKTSGSKGLQMYVPLNHDNVAYELTKPFAKAVAELLEGAEPSLVVARMTKARRAGKVLIDWSQNDAKKTTVCAYSLRARKRPTASTPVTWDEVRAAREHGDPARLTFESHEVLARVREHGDLFAPVLSLVQQLPSF
jgi:bifunctional non-homologous end joining protein LigD